VHYFLHYGTVPLLTNSGGALPAPDDLTIRRGSPGDCIQRYVGTSGSFSFAVTRLSEDERLFKTMYMCPDLTRLSRDPNQGIPVSGWDD